MSLSNTIVSKLKEFSKVPVYIGQSESSNTVSIVISPVKMEELVSMYDDVYKFTHTVWRNLPTPADCEPAFVIVWMIAADSYDVNHTTVSWQGVSANTFVHLWSTIDRLRSTMDVGTAYWLLGSRDPTGYARETGMPGAADTHLYQREVITPPHVAVFVDEFDRSTVTDPRRDFASFFEFRQSLRMPKRVATVDVAAMMMRNFEMADKPGSPRR